MSVAFKVSLREAKGIREAQREPRAAVNRPSEMATGPRLGINCYINRMRTGSGFVLLLVGTFSPLS